MVNFPNQLAYVQVLKAGASTSAPVAQLDDTPGAFGSQNIGRCFLEIFHPDGCPFPFVKKSWPLFILNWAIRNLRPSTSS
jgi:hypothetical protein